MNNLDNLKIKFLIFCLELKHNKFYKAVRTFFLTYLIIFFSFLITEIVLIFLNSEVLSGYEMVLVIICAYSIFLMVFGTYITKKPKHKNIEYLKLYFFAFCFLFCILNLGPLIFIHLVVVTSSIIKGEYGEDGTFTSKASVMIHGFAVLPIWILLTAWGMYQAYKMLTVQLLVKKQLETQKTDSKEDIIISDRTNDVKIVENKDSDDSEELSNPYLNKDLNDFNHISNSAIISVVCKKDKKILNEKYDKIKKNDSDNFSNKSDETDQLDSFENNKGTGSYKSENSQDMSN